MSPAAFPALEVVASTVAGVAEGARFPLDPGARFVIGRTPDNQLPVRTGAMSRHHCAVLFAEGRWRVQDLDSTNGLTVAGVRAKDAELRHGDMLGLPRGVWLRFLEHGEPEEEDAAMEQAIARAPDDAQRWAVYADWLLERGAPLGERLTRAGVAEDDRRWLGPLAGFAADGEVEVRWAHGLPQAVTLVRRAPSAPEVDWLTRVRWLARWPSFRFLRRLEVDAQALSRARGPVDVAELVSLVEALEGRLPLLEALCVGPLDAPVGLAPVEAALARRRAAWPRFATTAATLTFPWGDASLEVLALPDSGGWSLGPGATVALSRGSRHAIGPKQLGAVLWGPLGGDELHTQLHFANGRWNAFDFTATRALRRPRPNLKVNGRLAMQALLRSGDVLEPVDGLRLLFKAG